MSGMDMNDYASLGSAVLTGNSTYVRPIRGEALRARNQANGLNALASYALPDDPKLNPSLDQGGAYVGFTIPALSFDKMRQINGAALALNFDIERHVAREAFKDAWNRWFETWNHFFERYQTSSGKAGALFDSDAVANQTESFRQQLEKWVSAYGAESGPDGKPVPPSSSAIVPPSPEPGKGGDTTATSEGLPWWVTSLLVVGGLSVVAGTIFIIRRKAIEAKQAEHVIRRNVLPIVMGSVMGPAGTAFAHAAADGQYGAGRDPAMPAEGHRVFLSGFDGPNVPGRVVYVQP